MGTLGRIECQRDGHDQKMRTRSQSQRRTNPSTMLLGICTLLLYSTVDGGPCLKPSDLNDGVSKTPLLGFIRNSSEKRIASIHPQLADLHREDSNLTKSNYQTDSTILESFTISSQTVEGLPQKSASAVYSKVSNASARVNSTPESQTSITIPQYQASDNIPAGTLWTAPPLGSTNMLRRTTTDDAGTICALY